MAHQKYLESLNFNERAEKKEVGGFDTIADDLYKKLIKQGYIEQPSKVSKKKSKKEK